MTARPRPYCKRSKRTLRQHVVAHLTGEGPWTVPGYLAYLGFKQGSLPGGGTIGILELGGGWVPADLEASFASVGLPEPTITDVSVDGTRNLGASGGDASVEVALDYQVAGQAYAWLTGKPAVIDMLWAQDIGIAAIKSSELGHAACSCSWGADEPSWGAAGLVSMQAACVTCTDAGTTFCAASGDNDADDDDGTGKVSVDAPASCPNALACGGTSTPQGGPSVIWNNNPGNASGEGTGGGYSSTFPFQIFCTGPTGPGAHGLGRRWQRGPRHGVLHRVHGAGAGRRRDERRLAAVGWHHRSLRSEGSWTARGEALGCEGDRLHGRRLGDERGLPGGRLLRRRHPQWCGTRRSADWVGAPSATYSACSTRLPSNARASSGCASGGTLWPLAALQKRGDAHRRSRARYPHVVDAYARASPGSCSRRDAARHGRR